MPDDLEITFAHGTDIGQVRNHNEDFVAVCDPTEPDQKLKGRLFIVADGMGGYQAGEVASRLAAETVQREYYADPSDEPVTRLQNAVQAANTQVYQSAHGDRAHAGMGTTVVVTAILNNKACIASVGDSRAYLVRNGEIIQITQDHSLVGEQIRAGLLTKEQARTHPQRNVITRALGSQPVVQVDTFEGDLANGDILFMCSDGLTGHVPESRLTETVTALPPDQAVQRLIELANQDGGTDNISVIVLRAGTLAPAPAKAVAAPPPSGTATMPIKPPSSVSTRPARPTRKKRAGMAWIAVGAIIVLVAVAAVGILSAGGVWLWENRSKPTATPARASPMPTPLAPSTVTSLPVAPTMTTEPPVPGAPTSTLAPTLTPRPIVVPTISISPSPSTTVSPIPAPSATPKPEKDKSGDGGVLPPPQR